MNRNVEIICVGNELLTGHTLNTNAHWLSSEITDAGGIVRRVTVIRDEIEEIVSSVKESLKRKHAYIIISGGLGPTYDDKTLQGLAKALGRRLVVNKKAVNMLKRKYVKTSHPTLTPSRYKMATIPMGAEPLENPVGHAPAVMIKENSCLVFSLPGVPREMQSIFSVHILPIIKRRIGKFVRMSVSLETKGVTESMLSPYIDTVVAKNPNVYVKSHPKGYNKGVSILHVNIAAEAKSRKDANMYLKKASREMKLYVAKSGGSAREI
jgi:molybdenum cofactor synthesis domain-containing protein